MTPSPPHRVGIAGASGRMGRMLVEAVLAADDCRLGAAFDQPGSAALGQDAAAFLGQTSGAVIGADLSALAGSPASLRAAAGADGDRHHRL